MPVAIVVMGVSGSGKSTVGPLLAERLVASFVDADDLHAAESKAKMAAGIPLTDEDRWPWIRQVGEVLARETAAAGSAVVACSALRVSYRDLLRESAGGPVLFVHLHGAPELLEQRMAKREGHFMSAALLESQLATLEPLASNGAGAVADLALPLDTAIQIAFEAAVARKPRMLEVQRWTRSHAMSACPDIRCTLGGPRSRRELGRAA